MIAIVDPRQADAVMGAKAMPPLWQYFWRDGRTPRSGTFRVDLPEMSGPLRQARGLLDLRLHERGLGGRADPDALDVREFVDLRLRHLLHLLRGHVAFHGGLDVLLHEALVIGA